MWRLGRALAVLVFGLSVLLAAPAAAGPGEPVEPATAVVHAQDAPPGPDVNRDSGQQPIDKQRVAIGTSGIVLILLVFLSRKMRKKPVLYVQWKKKR